MMLYIVVLVMCFITPIIYYCRIRYEEGYNRRMRELEAVGIATALEQSQMQREESRAVRRKYIEERRARILQLFAPVRMVCIPGKVVDDQNTSFVYASHSLPPSCRR